LEEYLVVGFVAKKFGHSHLCGKWGASCASHRGKNREPGGRTEGGVVVWGRGGRARRRTERKKDSGRRRDFLWTEGRAGRRAPSKNWSAKMVRKGKALHLKKKKLCVEGPDNWSS